MPGSTEDAAPRVDVLTPIHKAIRAMTYDCAGALQSADFADAAEAGRTLERLERTLATVEDHRDHEDSILFPAMADREAELIDDLMAEHAEVGRLIQGVSATIDDVRNAGDPTARAQCGDELTRRFNTVAASYLGHFAREDVELLPATQRHLDDAQLVALRERIIASLPPDVHAEQLGWMFRALNRSEIVGMLMGARAAAPEPVFNDMAALAESSMGADRWAMVSRELGLERSQAA